MAQSKSAYATFCEQRGVKGVGLYIDEKLVDVVEKAAAVAGVKRNEWIIGKLIAGVRDAGYEYEVATKESLQDENTRLKAMLAAMMSANIAGAHDEVESAA